MFSDIFSPRHAVVIVKSTIINYAQLVTDKNIKLHLVTDIKLRMDTKVSLKNKDMIVCWVKAFLGKKSK